MIDQLVGQFLGSQDGKSAVAELGAHGLSPQQATGAVTATAEGMAAQLTGGGEGGGGGAGDLLGGLLGGGGGGGGGLGALAGLLGGAGGGGGGGNPLGALLGGGGGGGLGALGGLLGGAPAAGAAPGAAAANPLAGLTGPIGNFVAQKTGLAPAVAQTVVAVVLPKVVAYFQSSGAPAQQG